MMLFGLLLLATATFAASEAEYKKLVKSWTLNPDGSQEFNYKMELAIYTHTAMNSTYGESFIVYNPDYQTLTINESYTKQKDGNIVKTPDNAFVEVLPRNAANAPAYNQLKEMVVVHTGLELGATIYLDYTIKTKAGYLPQIDINEDLQQSSPVKSCEISISIPESKTLSYKIANRNEKASQSSSNGQKVYKWRFSNISAASRMIDSYHMDRQCIAANTYPSSKDMAETIYSQFEQKKTMPLVTMAEAITEKAANDKDKVVAIYQYMKGNYEMIPLSINETGYKIRPAEEVINSAYGTPAELANIMQGLLRAANIKANTLACFPDKYAEGYGLNKSIIFVETEADGNKYILATDDATIAALKTFRQYYSALNLENGTISEAKPMKLDLTFDANISADKDGKFNANVKASVPEYYLDIEGKKIKSFAGNDINSCKTNGDLAEMEYSKNISTEKAGNYIILSLPDCGTGNYLSMLALQGGKSNRLITLPGMINESYSYSVSSPANATVSSKSANKEITNSVGSVKINIKAENGKVNVSRSITISNPKIEAKDYPKFTELIRAWENQNYNSVIFEVKE